MSDLPPKSTVSASSDPAENMLQKASATTKVIQRVVAFETSCDETAVALYDVEQGLIGEKIYSQIELHQIYGGVVPELAARDHVRYALPLLQQLLQDCDTDLAAVDAIAYTKGPGLVGALLVGAALAKSLAWALSIPALGVHHMEAHLAAAMLEDQKPAYPYLAVLVSGGHSMLVEARALGDYQILGQTLDDAIGEAFDKTAKVLGLSYPGGPSVSACAVQGDPKAFTFPRPMVKQPGLDLSFSGLKTCVVNHWEKSDRSEKSQANIARAFEEAVTDTLKIKIKRALAQTNLQHIVVVGGVSANQRIRQMLDSAFTQHGYQVFLPRPAYCTDNAAMVACLAAQRMTRGERDSCHAIKVQARWSLQQLQPPKV